MANSAQSAVLVKSTFIGTDAVPIVGPSTLYDSTLLLDSMSSIGFQASNFGKAVKIAQAMLENRRLPSSTSDDEHQRATPTTTATTTMDEAHAADDETLPIVPTLYLGITANLLGTGVRESIQFLAKHKLIDVIVITGGGPEHDVRRTTNPEAYRVTSYGATEHTDARHLGEGHFGNVSYTKSPPRYHDVLRAILRDLILAKESIKRMSESSPRPDAYEDACRWAITPSEVWRTVGLRLAEFIGQAQAETSVLYWAAVRGIPIFSPSFTDGDVMAILEELQDDEEEPLTIKLDLVHDIHLLNKQAMKAKKTGMLILGGGVAKHHVCNANLMRNGADLSIFINNAQEFDGSDAGARPDEAVSWGKIRMDGQSVKVYAEISVVMPLLVLQAFVLFVKEQRRREKELEAGVGGTKD